MRKRGLFPAAAPRRGCRGYNPTHPAQNEPPLPPPPLRGPAAAAVYPPRAAPFFRRAAAHRAPRLCPAETAASPRPVRPPEGRRPRRPGPCRPPRGVPAAPGIRPARARVCPRPRAAPPGVCPQGGDQIPGRGLQETAAPSRVNFREIRDPGYSPKNSKQPPKMDGCSLIPQCSGGCL